MKLKEKQFMFPRLFIRLIDLMLRRGYKPILGFGYRCKECKVGKANSLHKLCLAQDVELHDAEGNYLTETEDHEQFGKFWESLHPLCSWGGRWKDGNHYSIQHGNMR
jgi:hypothetical protein